MEAAIAKAPSAVTMPKAKEVKEVLSPEKLQAIVRILEGASSQEIADELGVVYQTVLRWRRSKMFARELAHQAKAVSSTSLAILQSNVTHATQRLVEMIDSPKPDRTQFNAAMAVIKIVYENQLLQEMNVKIKDMEKAETREP